MKIGYLGPQASFTYAATSAIFKNEELVPFASISACLKAVEKKTVDLSVVPVENTIEGSVNTSVDYLFHQSHTPVVAELVLPIRQQLMVAKPQAKTWQETTKILSHPQALAQSEQFIQRTFPEIHLEATPSTAYAAQYVAQHPTQRLAAIAPESSAERYGLAIVQKNIQDVAINQTRFWVLGETPIHVPKPKQQQKMTISLTMPNNRPGALQQALAAFSWREISLSKIESRPLKTTLGEYFFLLDIEVPHALTLVENALAEIRLLGGEIQVFGNYPVYLLQENEGKGRESD